MEWKIPFFEKVKKVLTRDETLKRPGMGKDLKRQSTDQEYGSGYKKRGTIEN